MSLTSFGFVNQAQMNLEIEKAIDKLSKKEVVRVRYSLEEDSTGDPAIYFRVVLTDAASKVSVLGKVTRRISDTITNELHPLENWGRFPYFNFRSKSEQSKLHEPEWS